MLYNIIYVGDLFAFYVEQISLFFSRFLFEFSLIFPLSTSHLILSCPCFAFWKTFLIVWDLSAYPRVLLWAVRSMHNAHSLLYTVGTNLALTF